MIRLSKNDMESQKIIKRSPSYSYSYTHTHTHTHRHTFMLTYTVEGHTHAHRQRDILSYWEGSCERMREGKKCRGEREREILNTDYRMKRVSQSSHVCADIYTHTCTLTHTHTHTHTHAHSW